ncbi:MAG: AAA family ATPase [Myxococcales bacterium]
MLRELRVSGYRSLRDVSLELSPLTVVVGTNGSGKTNLYQSLQLLAAAAQGTLAQSLAAQGGLPSALWAGPRRKQESNRIELFVDLEDLAFELQLGIIPPPQGAFALDPDVKEERLLVEDRGKRHLVAERRGKSAWSRDVEGTRTTFPFQLWGGESVLSQVVEPLRFPLLAEVRARLTNWRFYHSFRTDADAPARQAQVGVRTPALAHDGGDLAAALMTIREIGDGAALDEAVARAFPGSSLALLGESGRFSFRLHVPGLLRPLEPPEASDGTLRFLFLLAALLSPRPPLFLALNEPETSLHPDMLEPLSRLIRSASERGQVFVVTHSDALAGFLRGAAVFTLEKHEGATSVSRR